MQIIKKKNGTMTPKERVLKTFNLEKTDRVTIGYDTNDIIRIKLAKALGINDGDYEKILKALDVDYRGIGAPYNGKCLFPEKEGRKINPEEGCYMRWIEHETGGYWDFCDFPLNGAEDDVIANYPVPNPDDFDYSVVGEQIENHKDYAIYIGHAGIADIINSNGRIMGIEDVLCHLLTENEAALYFIDRRIDMQIAVLERTLDKYKGKIDFMWMGEDLGTQINPMISLDLYRRVLKPRHQRYIDLAK